MKNKILSIALLGLASVGAGFAAKAVAAPSAPSLLETLERGLWQLRAVGGSASGATVSQLCLGDPNRLTQIQHGDTPCVRTILKSTPNSVTVSYSCKGQGQGLTTIRKESGRLIQIQSQGIRNSSPFSFQVEGRRAGKC